jgi:small-conductance mechanosensitive channel
VTDQSLVSLGEAVLEALDRCQEARKRVVACNERLNYVGCRDCDSAYWAAEKATAQKNYDFSLKVYDQARVALVEAIRKAAQPAPTPSARSEAESPETRRLPCCGRKMGWCVCGI